MDVPIGITRKIIYDSHTPNKIKNEIDENLHYLSLYKTPNLNEGAITLTEFYELGKRRLDILKTIESIREKIGSNSSQFFDNKEIKEQSEWFIKQEVDLFKFRFVWEASTINGLHSIRKFFRINQIELEEADRDTKKLFQSDMAQSLDIPEENILSSSIFTVEFSSVIDLLSSYRIFMFKGKAFIKFNDLFLLMSFHFREEIVSSIANAKKLLSGFMNKEDDRLLPTLRNLTSRNRACQDFDDNGAEDIMPHIDNLAQTSFPLCMKFIHNHLRSEHHLRHHARRQYGLFLKGLGVSVKSALEFFRHEFTKKIDADKFNKEYTYNIRYMYGLEGKRVDQQPFSCATIILGSAPIIGGGDCHGCPYKHWEKSFLANKLNSLGLKRQETDKIMELSQSNRFDMACTRFFEYTHDMKDGELGMLITHPNQYYNLSRKIKGEIK